MSLSELLLVVDKESYNVKPGNNVLSTKLEGGASRTRLDKIGATHSVNVQWKTNRKGYTYLMAFYRTTIKQGSLPFLIDLLVDSDIAEQYEAKIEPGTLTLASHTGETYIVTATLEVVPKTVNAGADAALVTAGP
jgi:hypothetical protein